MVLLTSGVDERPYTLAWPQGTVIFLVGCAGEHASGKKAAVARGLAVPEGCLLRRVTADLEVCAPSCSQVPRCVLFGRAEP